MLQTGTPAAGNRGHDRSDTVVIDQPVHAGRLNQTPLDIGSNKLPASDKLEQAEGRSVQLIIAVTRWRTGQGRDL